MNIEAVAILFFLGIGLGIYLAWVYLHWHWEIEKNKPELLEQEALNYFENWAHENDYNLEMLASLPEYADEETFIAHEGFIAGVAFEKKRGEKE